MYEQRDCLIVRQTTTAHLLSKLGPRRAVRCIACRAQDSLMPVEVPAAGWWAERVVPAGGDDADLGGLGPRRRPYIGLGEREATQGIRSVDRSSRMIMRDHRPTQQAELRRLDIDRLGLPGL